jgi:hypothetical protein
MSVAHCGGDILQLGAYGERFVERDLFHDCVMGNAQPASCDP